MKPHWINCFRKQYTYVRTYTQRAGFVLGEIVWLYLSLSILIFKQHEPTKTETNNSCQKRAEIQNYVAVKVTQTNYKHKIKLNIPNR